MTDNNAPDDTVMASVFPPFSGLWSTLLGLRSPCRSDGHCWGHRRNHCRPVCSHLASRYVCQRGQLQAADIATRWCDGKKLEITSNQSGQFWCKFPHTMWSIRARPQYRYWCDFHREVDRGKEYHPMPTIPWFYPDFAPPALQQDWSCASPTQPTWKMR